MMHSRFPLLTVGLASFSMILFAGQPTPAHTPNFGKLPLAFEPNVGQTDSTVLFLSRAKGMTVFLTGNEIVMSVHRPNDRAQRAAIRMRLAGARQPVANAVTGLDPQPGVSHYYIGNDPNQWHTNVPHYGRVGVKGVYDGIDLVAYGNQQELEYDFVVAPGANPAQVQLAFDGVDSISVNPAGDLVLRTPAGDVIQKRPRVYQDSAQGGRVDVAAKYVMGRNHGVSFELASYDRRKPLIIDPVIAYSSFISGTVYEQANGVAVDNNGAAYVVGTTSSASFPFTHATANGSDDAFVVKLSPAGNAAQYTTYIGGAANDRGLAIAVDRSGSAYIAGVTDSHSATTGFPQIGPVQSGFGGGFWDAFVAKLSGNGMLIISSFLGGSGDDTAFGIAIDPFNNIYVTGETASPDFPTTAGALKTANPSGIDAFVTKIGARGGVPVYSTYLGGALSEEHGRGIAVDSSGSAYITGWTLSSDFPTVTPVQPTNASLSAGDAFVSKLNPQGTALVYSTCLGGAQADQGLAIAIDDSGAAYITGNTKSNNIATPGALQTAFGGNSDAFVTKLTPAGSSIVYTTYLGGDQNDFGSGIAVDSAGNVYVAGYTASSTKSFPWTPSPFGNSGGIDAFVAGIGPAGNTLLYFTMLGGAADDKAYGIAVDAVGAAFVVGVTESTAFPTTPGSLQTSISGAAADDNAFITKIAGTPVPTGAQIYSPGATYLVEPCCNQSPQIGFAWTSVSRAASYRLDVGTTCGGVDYFSQNVGFSTSATVTVAPGPVCARLTTIFDSTSVHSDQKYSVIIQNKGPLR